MLFNIHQHVFTATVLAAEHQEERVREKKRIAFHSVTLRLRGPQSARVNVSVFIVYHLLPLFESSVSVAVWRILSNWRGRKRMPPCRAPSCQQYVRQLPELPEGERDWRSWPMVFFHWALISSHQNSVWISTSADRSAYRIYYVSQSSAT